MEAGGGFRPAGDVSPLGHCDIRGDQSTYGYTMHAELRGGSFDQLQLEHLTHTIATAANNPSVLQLQVTVD
jgi:hypothetical protein